MVSFRDLIRRVEFAVDRGTRGPNNCFGWFSEDLKRAGVNDRNKHAPRSEGVAWICDSGRNSCRVDQAGRWRKVRIFRFRRSRTRRTSNENQEKHSIYCTKKNKKPSTCLLVSARIDITISVYKKKTIHPNGREMAYSNDRVHFFRPNHIVPTETNVYIGLFR